MNSVISTNVNAIDAHDYKLVSMTPMELLEKLFKKHDKNNDNTISFS